jgi:cobyrinic acid a,c-diamide synthase
MDRPRVIIGALRGGSGKTIVSIGIIAALKSSGNIVSPFKKGPDYIDAGWLALAADKPCFNLDTFLVEEDRILGSFLTHSHSDEIAIIEGNRGLFDGIDLAGSTSTAELAKQLRTPVIFCIDCTKSTRTMAAAILGCRHFDPEVQIQGVILNRVAGPRHESILRRSIEHHCGYPVIGAIPKLTKENFPERHMGLTPIHEHEWAKESVVAARRMAQSHVDLDRIIKIAQAASPLPGAKTIEADVVPSIDTPIAEKPRIGIIRDSAFQFYYPDNLEALAGLGAELVYISPLTDTNLPPLDALYLGGGFPETHVEALAQNVTFREEIRRLADEGFPIYAECGGLMYLGESLILKGKSYPMAGVLPVKFGLSSKPKGHGYTILAVERENPFYPVGSEIRGHEFHYSYVEKWNGSDADLVFRMKRGTGFIDKRDGVRYKNVLAMYTHVHALGTTQWAPGLVRSAKKFKQNRKQVDIS